MNGIDNAQDGGSSIVHHHATHTHLPEMTEKPLEEAPPKDTLDPWENFDAQAAFLGPTLWDKRLPYDGQDFKVCCCISKLFCRQLLTRFEFQTA